jgi:hypothetical protein
VEEERREGAMRSSKRETLRRRSSSSRDLRRRSKGPLRRMG